MQLLRETKEKEVASYLINSAKTTNGRHMPSWTVRKYAAPVSVMGSPAVSAKRKQTSEGAHLAI